MIRRIVVLSLLTVSLGARAPVVGSMPGAAADGLTPGTRVLLDAHNSYPEGGRWADRIDRALSTGTPLAIEQDLLWYRDPATGIPRSIVSHGEPFTGREPGMREYFFERIRPIVERALQENRRDDWPIITLNLDFKSDEPEHHAAVWKLLGEYESWLCTAPRGAAIRRRRAADAAGAGARPDRRAGHPAAGLLRRHPAGRHAAPVWRGASDARWHARPQDQLPALVEQLVDPDRAGRAAQGRGMDAGRRAAADDRRPCGARRRAVDPLLHAGWLRSRRSVRRLGRELQLRLARRRPQRWRAAIRAGVDFVAVNQYEVLCRSCTRPGSRADTTARRGDRLRPSTPARRSAMPSRRTQHAALVTVAAALAITVAAMPAAQSSRAPEHWVATWGTAQQAFRAPAPATPPASAATAPAARPPRNGCPRAAAARFGGSQRPAGQRSGSRSQAPRGGRPAPQRRFGIPPRSPRPAESDHPDDRPDQPRRGRRSASGCRRRSAHRRSRSARRTSRSARPARPSSPASDRALTFGGKPGVTIYAGQVAGQRSGPARRPAAVRPRGQPLLPWRDRPADRPHLRAAADLRLEARGRDRCRSLDDLATTTESYYWLTGVDVLAPASAGTLVTFGDSITDGDQSTPDTLGMWPAVLAARLQADRPPRRRRRQRRNLRQSRARRQQQRTGAARARRARRPGRALDHAARRHQRHHRGHARRARRARRSPPRR